MYFEVTPELLLSIVTVCPKTLFILDTIVNKTAVSLSILEKHLIICEFIFIVLAVDYLFLLWWVLFDFKI